MKLQYLCYKLLIVLQFGREEMFLGSSSKPLYETVPLDELRQGRAGKHQKLIENVLADLQKLPEGQAIKIPLDSLKVTKANLRAAIVRAANSRGISVATYSDDENFFLWPRTKKTAQYERKRQKH